MTRTHNGAGGYGLPAPGPVRAIFQPGLSAQA